MNKPRISLACLLGAIFALYGTPDASAADENSGFANIVVWYTNNTGHPVTDIHFATAGLFKRDDGTLSHTFDLDWHTFVPEGYPPGLAVRFPLQLTSPITNAYWTPSCPTTSTSFLRTSGRARLTRGASWQVHWIWPTVRGPDIRLFERGICLGGR